MHTGKSLKIMAALFAAALLFAGCSDKTKSPDTTDAPSGSEETAPSENEAAAKSVAEIYQEIEQTVSLKSPQSMDEDFILNYYDIDTTTLEEYVFSMSEDAAQAETIILMKVKNPEDLETFADSLQTIVEDKKNEMENYIPEQFAIVEKSKVQTKDTYIWLVISENADEIIDIIQSGLF